MSIMFGKRSREVLATLHPVLQAVLVRVAENCPEQHDFSLTEGHRPPARQKQLYNDGYSQIDGYEVKGYHNYDPALAVDIYPYQPGFGVLIPNTECYREILKHHGLPITMDNIHRAEKYVLNKMSIIAGMILSTAAELGENVTWGTDWDSDGFMLDHNFLDYPHFQIEGYKPAN